MADGPPPRFGPGRRVVFRPDHKDFGFFMRSDQMRDVTAEVARDIARRAGQLAPRRRGAPEGTSMADQFRVNREAGTIKVGKAFRNVRVMVHVYNEATSAAANEFGGRGGAGNKRHRMLFRAGMEFGDAKGEI